MSGFGAAAASALGNMASGGFSFGLGLLSNQMNRDWSEQQYLKYQSPQAIMQQMIDAGINPNAAAQGISGSGPASMMNTASQVTPDFGAIGSDAVNAYYGAKIADAQEENIKADTDYTRSKTVGQDIENDWSPEQFRTAIAEALSRITKNDTDSKYVEEQTRQLIEMFPDQKELLHFKVEEVKEMVEKIKKERDVMDQEIRESESRIGVNGAQKAKLDSETAINNFILENGYDPRSPEGKMIIKLSSTDPKDRKEGEQLMDAIIEVQDKADEEIRNNDPIVQQEKQLKEQYEKDVARVDELLEKDKKELHEYEMGRKRIIGSNLRSISLERRLKLLKVRRNSFIVIILRVFVD